MSQIKKELTHQNIDEMNRSMQELIEEADRYLNRLENLSSNSDSSTHSTLNVSANLQSTQDINTEPEREREVATGTGLEDVSSVSILSSVTLNDNDSSGSDTTIVCGHDEPMPEPTVLTHRTMPEPMLDNSVEQDVIVIGTPTVESRSRRGIHRNTAVPNADTSIIDLSYYPEVRNPPPPPPPSEPIIVLSSDEENDEAAAVATTQQPLSRSNYSQVRIDNYAISVQTSTPHSISVSVNNTDRNRMGAPTPAASPPAVSTPLPVCHTPPAQQQRNSTGTSEEDTSKTTSIICPICYETLANRRAISTSCGHVFCAQCIKLSLRTAKKCPICKKGLTRANQMHPVYFSTQ